MKKIVSLLVIVTFFLALGAPAFSEGWNEDSFDKLKEGAKTIAKAPLEVSRSVAEESKAAEFKPFGAFGGFLKGTFYMFKAAGEGLIEVLTFNVDYFKETKE